MFKRKKSEADDQELLLEAAAALLPAETASVERTTCYPQDGEAPPGVPGVPRTTVYRQAVRWNRGGYDTVN